MFMKYLVKHLLKIVFILSLGLGITTIAQGAKTFTKNHKSLHSTSKSTQNQLVIDLEEEEVEEEVDQNEPSIEKVFSLAKFSITTSLLNILKQEITTSQEHFDLIKAYQISYFLAFQNLRL